MTTLSPAPDAADDRRALRNVAVLVASQALLGAQIPMVIVVAGLSGQALASNPCWATLPVSLMVLGSMLTATPLAALMQRRGRLAGFLVGTCGGALGGAIGAAGLYLGSFPVFLAGAFATGIYMSAQGFYRFAATDTASPSFRPKAISWVMAGGLLSAIVGPQLVKVTAEALAIPFLGTYLAVVVLNLAGAPLFAFLDIPRPAPAATAAPRGRSRRELIRSPTIAVAIVCATVAYALMNLVMTSSPLAIVGCGYMTADAANVVTAHVLAMFAPSFVTGHLISRFGTARIIGAGLVVLAAAGAVALAGVTLGHFYATLILLGIGWNFGFIGATTLLAGAHTPEERGRLQGLNDLVVFGGVTFASFASGGLMNCLGGSVQAGWSAVNLAMLPFLVLAGGALIWLGLRPRRA
ncbi:MAG: MFS transporter [Rhodobacteraceae bacterium]|nr:MFS transporter [Paracoccaceae bacterium]